MPGSNLEVDRPQQSFYDHMMAVTMVMMVMMTMTVMMIMMTIMVTSMRILNAESVTIKYVTPLRSIIL